MGSGGSKNNLDVGYDANRRPSHHELTNPPTESRGLFDFMNNDGLFLTTFIIRFSSMQNM